MTNMPKYPKWCVASSGFPFGIYIHSTWRTKLFATIAAAFLAPRDCVVMETEDALKRDEDIIQWAAEYYGFDPDRVDRQYP